MVRMRTQVWTVILAASLAAVALAKDDADRAAALKSKGVSLGQCIDKAAAVGHGPAVFANVHVGKRGRFAVNVDCVVDGKRVPVLVNHKGRASVKETPNRERQNEADLPAIAAQLTQAKVTLAELVSVAEKSNGGTAVNAFGFLKDGAARVAVLVVSGEKSERVVVDIKTKQVVQE